VHRQSVECNKRYFQVYFNTPFSLWRFAIYVVIPEVVRRQFTSEITYSLRYSHSERHVGSWLPNQRGCSRSLAASRVVCSLKPQRAPRGFKLKSHSLFVAHTRAYTRATGLNVDRIPYLTAYNSLRKLLPPPRRLPSRIYSRFP
jgi:hypothetical protein